MRLQQLKNFLFLTLLLLVPSIVFAAPLLDPINDSFKNAILGTNPGWQIIITATAKSLFWKLVLLDFTWTAIVYVKDRKEIGEILSSYVGKIFTIGFFWLLLQMASTWIPALIGLFSETGQAVATANKAQVDSLDGVFTQGLALAAAIMTTLDGLDVFEKIYMGIPATIGAFCAALGFAFIAGQLLVTLIESYIGIAAGIIMLGFGGSRWTSDMATNYLKFAMGVGLKLMLCYLIIGLGFNLFSNIIPPNGLNDPTEFLAYVFRVSALVLIYVYLVFNIPGLASAIMSGSPNMSMGGMLGAAITGGAAVASGGAAVAAGAGKAAALGGAVAAQGVGLGKAAGAAFSANKAGGMGNMESALMAPVPMIKSAASMLGAKAMDAGKGAVEGGKGALNKAKGAIDNSVGGKIAADIAAKSEAASAPPAAPAATAVTPPAAAASAAQDTGGTATGNPDATTGKPADPAQTPTKPGGDKSKELGEGTPVAQTSAKTDTNSTGAGSPGALVGNILSQLNAGNPAAAGGGNPADVPKQAKGATSDGVSDFDTPPGTFQKGMVGNSVDASGGDVDTGGGGGGGASTSSLPEGGPSSLPGEKLGEPPSALGGNEADRTMGDEGSQLNEPGGNASGAKVGASDPQTRLLEAISANMAKMEQMGQMEKARKESGDRQKPKLHENISGLQRFVPQDAASVAAAPITMGHTRD